MSVKIKVYQSITDYTHTNQNISKYIHTNQTISQNQKNYSESQCLGVCEIITDINLSYLLVPAMIPLMNNLICWTYLKWIWRKWGRKKFVEENSRKAVEKKRKGKRVSSSFLCIEQQRGRKKKPQEQHYNINKGNKGNKGNIARSTRAKGEHL